MAVLHVDEIEPRFSGETCGAGERVDHPVDLVVAQDRAGVVDPGPLVERGMGERGSSAAVGPPPAVGQLQTDERRASEYRLCRRDE